MTEPVVTYSGFSTDPEYQLMSSRRYDNKGFHARAVEGHEDRWALYDKEYTLIAIGPWDSLKAIAKNLKPPERKEVVFPTLNLDLSLEDLGL